MKYLIALVVLLALTATTPCPAIAQKRVALVVGNSTYKAGGYLPNPINDASIVASALRQAQFTIVETKNDLGIAEFRQSLRRFQTLSDGADVAVMYFAGHGVEDSGTNWLIPVDAELAAVRDLEYEAIRLDLALQALGGARMRLLVLDACRNNPFGRNWQATNRDVNRGLRRLEADDVLVLYAAAPGQLASDGTDGNSPFASSLAKRLTEPGLAIQLLGGRVRDDVLKITGGAQRPYVSASVTGEPFYLMPGISAPAPPSNPSSLPLAPGEAERFWDTVKDSRDPAALEAFVRRYGHTFHGDLAKARLSSIKAEEIERQALLQKERETQRAASETKQRELAVETPPPAAMAPPSRAFDGHWYSPEWKYGYRLVDGVGVATSTNSSRFNVGDVIIRIRAVAPGIFEGEQVYRDGRWYRIRGELRSDGRIYIAGEKNVSWTMVQIH